MWLYLVHHGDAVVSEIDPQRPLSPRGAEGVKQVAAEAAARGVKPAAIWHSGKLRARQTAEMLWRACHPLAELSASRGLQPTDPPEWIVDRVAGETRDLMLVGHMPNLAGVRARLAGASEAEGFPQHGLVALERLEGAWHERWVIT